MKEDRLKVYLIFFCWLSIECGGVLCEKCIERVRKMENEILTLSAKGAKNARLGKRNCKSILKPGDNLLVCCIFSMHNYEQNCTVIAFERAQM